MRARDIIAAFGGVPVTDTRPDLGATCPECGTRTGLSVTGHASLCLPCTERDLGETQRDLALRHEFGLSRKRYQEKLWKDGPPHIMPKRWITSLAKQRMFRKQAS